MISSMQVKFSATGAARGLRFMVVLLAVLAMLGVSAASVSSEHSHLRGPSDRCDVCVAAHMSASPAVVSPVLHAPEPVRSFASLPVVLRANSRSVLTLVTRGPPENL